MPEFFSRMSISCNRLTNLLSLGWLRRARLFTVLLLFWVATFEEEFGSGVTGMDPNLSFSMSEKEGGGARKMVECIACYHEQAPFNLERYRIVLKNRGYMDEGLFKHSTYRS